MSTILVTGANGFVGSHVVPALLDAGHRIVALVRDDAGGRQVLDRAGSDAASRVEIRTGDITKPETLEGRLSGVDAVVHLAAIPRDWTRGQTLLLVNTEGTRTVLEAAKAAGVRRFVHLGALGVADDPELHYGRSKAKAMALVRDSGLDWTILMPSLLFGPGDGFFNILAGLVRMSPGVVPLTGNGGARFQPLAIGDLARIVVATLADDATIRREYELGGPRIWTYREMMVETLHAMGARRLLLPMPVALIRLVAGAAELVRIPFPVATDQLRQLRLDNVASDADPAGVVREAFGFDPMPMEGSLGYLRTKVRDQLAARVAGRA